MPRGYWSDDHIKQFCVSHFNCNKKVKSEEQPSTIATSEEIYLTGPAKPTLKKVVYKPADLHKTVSGLDYLLVDKKPLLLKTLEKYPTIFEGKRKDWKGEEVSIHLKTGSKPYYA